MLTRIFSIKNPTQRTSREMLQGNRKKIHASKVYQQYSILDLQYAEFA